MASPHVAGLAALLISQGISDPATVEQAIRHFAKDLGTPGRDNDFGDGLIDARATLRGLGLLR
jgi:serine protease